MKRLAFVVLTMLAPLDDAAAQIGYGQCQDRARDRLERDQRNPTVGVDSARRKYQADMHECVRIDARERARDRTEDEEFRREQQRLDQRRDEQQRQRQLDQQRRDRR